MKTNLWSGIFLALALTGLAAGKQAAPQSDYKPLKIIQTVEPGFPLRLQNSPIMNGEARIVVRVDTEGRLAEWLVIGYTRAEFADEALDALKNWKYEPAMLRGAKWVTVQELQFTFSRTGVVISQTGVEYLENYMERMVPSRYSFRAYQLRELDRIPVPRKVVPPGYPDDLVAKGVEGSVTVEFYIDATGQVRMPGALEWTNDALANLAVAAVKEWQFEPPLRDGKPVLVLARQVFRFKPNS